MNMLAKRQRILRGQLVKALLLDLITLPDRATISTAQVYDPVDSQLLPKVREIFTRYHRAGVIERYYLRVRLVLGELEKRQLIRLRSFAPSHASVLSADSLRDGYKVEILLTDIGQQLAYRHALANLEIQPQPRWDGLWRLVGLDIPETKKSLRDTVRQLLKRLGFKLLQRSLWAIPYPCKGELKVVKIAFGLKAMMWYIEAATIDREQELRQRFRLRR